MKKRILAMLVSVVMIMALLPTGAFAFVPEEERPNSNSLATNLVIGILNDSQADGEGEFPNEPSVTGYSYYYLQNSLSLSTSFLRANFTNNAVGNYIDIDAFWKDPRINMHEDGNEKVFGYYDPTGLDIANDDFFRDGLENILDKETIIEAWISAERLTGVKASDYDILFYVLKYETGTTSGYHLDAKIVKKNNVTLSYDANKPAGTTADVLLPSSTSVAKDTSVTVSGMPAAGSEVLEANEIIYKFTGWNTQADGNGVYYAPGSTITVSQNTVLYAQWEAENYYSVTYRNHNNELLLKVDNLFNGTKINPETLYENNGGIEPTKDAESHTVYSFTGWELVEGSYNNNDGITGNLVYQAQFEGTTIAHKATVSVVLNGTFNSDDEMLTGELIDIEDITSSDGSIYLKAKDGTGSYITLDRENEGVYSNDAVLNGDYYIYIESDGDYVQVGTQILTIANADRTRYLPYYSVEYFDGVSTDAFVTEYYYIGSEVNIIKEIPERNNFVFTHWNDGTDDYNRSTDMLTVGLTNNITSAYSLTAQWDVAATVSVKVVVNHNGRTSNVEEDLLIHLTIKNESTGNYNEVGQTLQTIASSDWYDQKEITNYNAGTLYANLSSSAAYGAHAAISGYRSETERQGGHIVIEQNGNDYTVTFYLIYDPIGYELPFTVKIDPDTPDRMIPQAVDVKVTRWDGTSWEPIPQHKDQSVEVEIDKETLSGTGSVHVWGFEGGDTDEPYLYRIKVVRIDLGNYQLTATEETAAVSYITVESGFFPEGAYTAEVEVTDSDKEGSDGLQGAHANADYQHHGSIVATVYVNPYDVEFDPNGGQWSESDNTVKTVEDRFTIPDLSGYVPTKANETFDGWYTDLNDPDSKVASGDYINEYVLTVGGTLTLYAKWKPNLTVKGTVVISLGEYPCTDDNRTVTVSLQMHKGDGTYEVTNFTQQVPLTPVSPDNIYATGDYKFANVPDIGQYRVSVIVPGGGTVSYQNEPDSLDEANLYTENKYAADKYVAALNGDTVAVVNIYMKASTFDLGYMADTSAIAEDFRPTDLKLDLRHDHRDSNNVSYEVIKDDISITAFNNGLSDIATVAVPQYHANGYLYDYVISVLSYDLDEHVMGADVNGWNDRHYYHYDTTDGYFPAPFSIHYTGPSNYSETVNADGLNQDVTLKAIFEPNTYNITYDLVNGTWPDTSHIGPSSHTWGVDTAIPVPIRVGYTFTGWTAEVDGTYDAENSVIPARVWQNVKLTANWERDIWKDEGDKYDEGDGIPDKYQALLAYAVDGGTWDGTDAELKWYVITLKEKGTDGEWTDISPVPILGSYTPDVSNAQPDEAHTTPASWTPAYNEADTVKPGYTLYTYKFTDGNRIQVDPNGGIWNYKGQDYTTIQTIIVDLPVDLGTPTRDGYVFRNWERSDGTGDIVYIYKALWEEDENGDGIADIYQKKITFKIENGKWSDGTSTDKVYVVDLKNESEEYSELGKADISGIIPVDMTANSGYRGGEWDVTPPTEVTGHQEVTYTYTYTKSNSGGGGGGSSKYVLTYDSNGGTEFPDEKHSPGTTVELDNVPKKDGYIFDGWHLDEHLNEDAEEVTMTKNITVYAAWIEDNGAAGNGHDTPSSLNGDDHFAYVVGYPDGNVKPHNNITRAEVTSIFFRLLKDDTRNSNLAYTNAFNDADSDDWFNTAVSTMSKLGIVNGRKTNKFAPNEYITRAEFAVICARFDNSEYVVSDEFTDVNGHWAEEEIHEAAAHGWIRGYENGTFRPDAYITRAEAMTMINRVLNRVPESDNDLLPNMVVWPDNSDKTAWYYLPVQEATNSHNFEMKNNIYERWTSLEEARDWTQYE